MPPRDPQSEITTQLVLVDDIVREGVTGDLGTFAKMLKGASDAMGGLLALVKGKKAPPPPPARDGDEDERDEDEGAGGDGDGDAPAAPPEPPERGREGDEPESKDEEEPEADGDGKPGFKDLDMHKGETLVDATEWFNHIGQFIAGQNATMARQNAALDRQGAALLAQGARIERLHKALTARDAQFADLRQRIDAGNERQEEFIGAFASTSAGILGANATLQKGVSSLEVALAHTPGSTPGASSRAAALRNHLDQATGATRLPPVLLMKAANKVREGGAIITPEEFHTYQSTGVFCADAARNQALAARVAALA